MKKTVLFVCTGNVCRSPMAEGFFRHRTADSKAFEVVSAGLGAMDGQPPSEHSVQALQEFGIDISRLRSQGITADLVNRADYIFGMTSNHVDAIRMMYPHAAEKTFLLNEFNDGLQGIEKEIADPIGGSYAVYVQCRDQIQKAIDSIMKFIEASQSKENNPAPAGVAIAVGADHAGYELKQSLVNVLKEGGFQVDDLGAHSSASTDYPDYAQAVARKVSCGEAPFGMLVCSSGIGMSIAANKHRNVRAALVASEGLARLSREHNDANILCLGSNFLTQEEAEKIVRAFFTSEFQGGRHARRLGKLEIYPGSCSQHTQKTDPAIAKVLEDERRRQQENVELIASENFTSQAVMEATGSVLTNKYAEGYPGKRWYGGCEHVDVAETAAIDRAKELFGAEHANVQPHSGSGANMAVYFSMLQPGDKMLTMDLSHGGHLTHGNKANFSGRFFEIVHYGVRKEDERIDYDQLGLLAREHRPKMITVGASAYPRIIDFERMAEIAHEVGALLLADIAHIAGLVAAGLHPSPVPHADFVTTTTHKTLRGPRGGLILCREEFAKKIDSQTFPGIQGGPLMHVIAAKAVCLKEASQPEFKVYQGQIIQNARALAERIAEKGFRLVSGGTDNHVMLVDVGEKGLNGKECQAALDEAGITTNKNTIPFETLSPFKASGIRLGTPAVTTRGMKEPEMVEIADMIAEVLFDIKNVDAAHKVRERVRELTARFPLPY